MLVGSAPPQILLGLRRIRTTGGERLVCPENEGAGGGERAAGAVDAGQFRAGDLTLAAFAAELADGLDQKKHPVHPRVGVREAAAVGVEGEVAAGGGALAGDEGAALALFADAQRFPCDERGLGERVVDLGHVDVIVTDSGHLEGEGAGDAGGGGG